ncbi:PREDICTED: mas-related G-protein coupled receptor member A6-like [Dipodomys ordii]|uniref:Mas-related G-protein coupled receptor member A6-like n=1 Tax=Dipodomys ordii TaxID=10020 RepID=A0A1S3FG17_DIPOR|nr:PREDICTED: mas-related G-protein coupled receptor member A6-like [Dipodomys ordii]
MNVEDWGKPFVAVIQLWCRKEIAWWTSLLRVHDTAKKEPKDTTKPSENTEKQLFNKAVDSAIAQSEKGSSSPQQVTPATLNRKMEERSTNGVIVGLEPTTSALITEVMGTYDYNHTYQGHCFMEVTILMWLNVIIDVIGLAGNTAVIWLLGFRIRRNVISVYILNLAVADFFYLCSNFIAGLSFLSVISLERCLSVLCPIWYRCHRPTHVSSFMCVIVWTLSLPLAFLVSYYCQGLLTYFDWKSCLLVRLSSAGYLLCLFVILSGSSLALTVRMFCGPQRMSLTRLYVTILLTVLVFIFCGLPHGIGYYLHGVTYVVFQFTCYSPNLLFLLTSINSCANPIIYFFVGSFRQQQRQTLKHVLQRALQDTPEDNERGGSLSQGTLEMSGSRVEQ